MMTWKKLVILFAAIAAVLIAAACGPSIDPGIVPIPNEGDTSLPTFIGATAHRQPLASPGVPQNPSLAPNPYNNVHADTWMSDACETDGPLGVNPEVLSTTLITARRSPKSTTFLCGSISFDGQGRLMMSCAGSTEAGIVLADPVSLKVISHYDLPLNSSVAASTSSAYAYLDNLNQMVVATAENKIQVGKQNGTGSGTILSPGPVYDVNAFIPYGDNMNGVMPDFQGRIWFAIRAASTVGVVDTSVGPPSVNVLALGDGGEIKNSFAVDGVDAYVVTSKAMYRLTADLDGVPKVVWSATYQNIGTIKPGQYSAGSGTTPTVLGGGAYVAIADNADQTHVVVYRTASELAPSQQRTVCEVPVFKSGAGAVEDSLIGSGMSMIVENNYGYTMDFNTMKSTPSTPGMARVDINPDGNGCTLVWETDKVTAPNVAPKMSTGTGLIYTLTRQYDTNPKYEAPGLGVWYWTAIDFRTGAVVWERQAGTGNGYDGWYAGLAIGPTGTAYIGQYGGLIVIRDTK